MGGKDLNKPFNPLRMHFIGIGGIGMSGIAEILLSMGHQISGSDRQKTDITDYLESKGASIYEGHKAENVGDVDYVIYSSAIPKDNPEMELARSRNITLIRRAEMLGQLMNRYFGIGVAGTHGKTSTTSMLGEILIVAQLDPTLVIGGRIKSLMTNARLGKGEIMLAEADEYDRSFLALNPRMAVMTSLESDHLDIYKDLDDIKNTFLKYAANLPFDGMLVINIDDPNLVAIRERFQTRVLTFGLSEKANYRAENIMYNHNSSTFEVSVNGSKFVYIDLQVPGEHNVRNALAAIVIACELGIGPEMIKKSLGAFTGVERRFDIKGTPNDVMIVDDYAHHPTEVETTLQAARSGWQRRLIAIFQPHLFSRTRDFYAEFAKALNIADVVLIAEIYPAREEPIPGITGKLISDALISSGHKNTMYFSEQNAIIEQLLKIIKPGDLVLTMGAGDIFQIADELNKRFSGMQDD